MEREGIDLDHHGTERMIADVLTKSLQGALFRMMRDIIMGHPCFPTEERVGSSRKMTKSAVGAKSDVSTRNPTYAEILKRERSKR